MQVVLACLLAASLTAASPVAQDDQEEQQQEMLSFPDEEAAAADIFDEGLFTDDEKACFAGRKFWFMGGCHALVRDAKDGPCGAGRWLVLDAASSSLKPECKSKPCASVREIWWPATGKCEVKAELKTKACNAPNKEIHTNFYGEGICRCKDGFGELEVGGTCYEYYQRAPCARDEIFAYDGTTGLGVCTKDLCQDKNKKKARRDYAPLEGDGPCYKLGGSEPCTIVDPQSRFVVDAIANVPRCHQPNKHLHVVDAPVLCRVGAGNKCQSEVAIKQTDRSSYLNDIRNQLNKRG